MGQTRRKRSTKLAVAVFRNGLVEGEVVAQNSSKTRLELSIKITKLPPGKHGFHIHKAGDLRGEGCKKACAHFHKGVESNHGGAPGESKYRHTGDLGNIEMPSSGPLIKKYILTNVVVQELWGRSIIVHADEDDLGHGQYEDSKTTGHSGSRIACAIFGRGEEC